VRGLVSGVAVLALVCVAGCAKKESVVTRIEGSEPQRLSFGAPKDVLRAVLDKVKLCWLSPPDGRLAGAKYDAAPAILDTGAGPLDIELITVYPPDGSTGRNFNIEFHRFNDNTLISTRNRGFPPQLAAVLKRDVETWILERNGCDISDAPDADLKSEPGAAGRPQRSF
jgi:hypothetical protein